MSLLCWTNLQTARVEDPRTETTLEIGVYITNGYDSEDPFKFRGAAGYALDLHGTAEGVLSLTPEVEGRLAANGLLEQISMGICVPRLAAEEEIIELMYRYGEPGDFTMAGVNVEGMRSSLKWSFPDLYKMYGADLLDLSGFRNVLKHSGHGGDVKEAALVYRSVKDAESYFREFMRYVELLGRALGEHGSEFH